MGALKDMFLRFGGVVTSRTFVGIGSLGANALFLRTGIEPAMKAFGTRNSFQGIQSEKSRLECIKINGVPDIVGPAMFFLKILTLLFSLNSGADAMGVVGGDTDAINQKGDGCLRIMETLFDG
jgi:hypothetical protein